jgi:hypothetical protein
LKSSVPMIGVEEGVAENVSRPARFEIVVRGE